MAGWRTTYGSPLLRRPRARPRRAASSSGSGGPARCRSARPTCRSSRPGRHTFNTIFGTTLNPVDPTRVRGRLERGSGVRAARRAWCRSPTAPTWAARCATRRRSAAWSGCGRSLGRVPAWPHGQPVGEHLASAGRWRATSATWRCCCRCSPAPTRARRWRWATRASTFAPPLSGALSGAAGRGVAPTSAARSRSTPRWRRWWSPRRPRFGGGRRAGRGGAPGPLARRGHLPHPAGVALPGAASATCSREHPDAFKPSLADNIRAGESLTGADVARAYRQRTALAETDAAVLRVVRRAGAADLARCRRSRPTRSTPPTINGRPMATYLDWMRSAYFITVTGCPAISVPGRHDPRRAPRRRPDRRAARRRPPAARGRRRLRGAQRLRGRGARSALGQRSSAAPQIGEGPRQYECQGPSLTAVVTQRSPLSRSGPGPAVTREPRRPKPPCEPSPS